MTQRNVIPRRREEPSEREDKYPVERGWRDAGGFWDRAWNMMPFGEEGAFTPRIDITETDEWVKVSAELPGMDRNDIEVKAG